MVLVVSDRGVGQLTLLQVLFQGLFQRDAGRLRPRRRINARLNCGHEFSGLISGLVKTDMVGPADFDPHGSNMTLFPPNIALDGKGLAGLMTDAHQPFHIGVPMDARAKWEVSDTGLGEFEYGHGKYSPEYSVCD